jgi:hypothetical protein
MYPGGPKTSVTDDIMTKAEVIIYKGKKVRITGFTGEPNIITDLYIP